MLQRRPMPKGFALILYIHDAYQETLIYCTIRTSIFYLGHLLSLQTSCIMFPLRIVSGAGGNSTLSDTMRKRSPWRAYALLPWAEQVPSGGGTEPGLNRSGNCAPAVDILGWCFSVLSQGLPG